MLLFDVEPNAQSVAIAGGASHDKLSLWYADQTQDSAPERSVTSDSPLADRLPIDLGLNSGARPKTVALDLVVAGLLHHAEFGGAGLVAVGVTRVGAS